MRGLSPDCGSGCHAPLCSGRNCSCDCHGPARAAGGHRVHLDRDGRARCGNRAASQFTADREQVTCGTCLNIIDGTHGIGNRQPDEPCGTAAAYRRHRRRGERACPWCLAAERRRNADRRARYGRAA